MEEYKVLITDTVVEELNEKCIDLTDIQISRLCELVYETVEDFLSSFLRSSQFDGTIDDIKNQSMK